MNIKLKNKDVISIVGTGGKTTLIKRYTERLSLNKKILMAASTKFIPPKINNMRVFCSSDIYEIVKNIEKYNVFVFGEKVVDQKYVGISDYNIKYLKDYFDYIFIEADGSRHLPYKGWSSTEPVILNSTTKTIGIIPLIYYGEIVPKHRIFNYDIYINEFGTGLLNKEKILKIVRNKNGIFKNAIGEKILYFTQWHHLNNKEVKMLSKYIEKNTDIKVVLGSKWEK